MIYARGATNMGVRGSCFAAVVRPNLCVLVLLATLAGSGAPAGAAENYRGHDPDSYECRSDYRILNRFSALPAVPAARRWLNQNGQP